MLQEYYAIDLPGKMLYDKDFNVSVRKITPLEQKYILSLSQKEQRTSKDYLTFIKNLVRIDNSEIKFEDLFWFDVEYMLYRLRFVTYAKYPIKLVFTCRECGEKIKQDLKMEELIINTPDDLPDLKRTLELENLGETKIRNKCVGDDVIIEEFAKANDIDVVNDLQMRLLLTDLLVISNGKSLNEMYEKASSGEVTVSDIYEIEKWLQDTVWGVKQEMVVKCPKCGKEETRGYSLSLEDFFSIF